MCITTLIHIRIESKDLRPFFDYVFRALNFARSPWGELELVTVTEDLGRYFDTSEGLLVVSAPNDGAMDIDLKEGDVMLSISGRTPNSPEHAIRILSSFEAGETIELSIMRDRRRNGPPLRSVRRLGRLPPGLSVDVRRGFRQSGVSCDVVLDPQRRVVRLDKLGNSGARFP